MLSRAQVLDGHKGWESKSCISSQPRRLAAWFTRLVCHGIGACSNRWEGRVVPYCWKTRCCVVLCIWTKTGFLRWKINCIFRLSLCSAPFLSPFFKGKKKSDTVYVFVTCRFYLFFPVYKYMEDVFFVAIVKLWNMNKGVQYDMSCCYMIFAMLPRDIPGVSMHTLRCSLLRCMCFFGHVL